MLIIIGLQLGLSNIKYVIFGVGAMIVGTIVVGAMIVGAMIVGAMIVGAMIVGTMVVGTMIVGAMRRPRGKGLIAFRGRMRTNTTEVSTGCLVVQEH